MRPTTRLLLRRTRQGRRSPVVGLVILALVGLALAALDWSHFVVSWSHIRTALGESLIVAAALGLTVDFFYKRALARDAFEASLGYLLPDELKAELRWIYGQQLIAVQHEEHIVLRPLDGQDAGHPRRVRVEFETWRTMRNVSNQRVEHPTFASVEEWFRGEESGVELIECVRGDERYSGGSLVVHDPHVDGAPTHPGRHGHGHDAPPLAPSQLDRHRPGVERKLEKRVILEPGEEVTFRYRGHEVHYESGAFHDVYGAPTCRPAVTVEAPPELRAVVSFANRGRTDVTELGGRSVLPTVLLPFQSIVVRWWPAEQHEAWLRAHADRVRARS